MLQLSPTGKCSFEVIPCFLTLSSPSCSTLLFFPLTEQSKNPCPSLWLVEREKTPLTPASPPLPPHWTLLLIPRPPTAQWPSPFCRDTLAWQPASMSSCVLPWSCRAGSRRRWTGEAPGRSSFHTPAHFHACLSLCAMRSF